MCLVVVFNPCFSGSYSAREVASYAKYRTNVSILVLVEVTLQVQHVQTQLFEEDRFNPCFSGSYSASRRVVLDRR